VQWNDPKVVEFASDSPLRRKYRRLQSWYRQTVLGVTDAGLDAKGRPIGSLLPGGAVAQDPSLNFLRRPELARIAEERIADTSGTVEADRLRRNMLSSQPLAVNLFGPLCNVRPDTAAPVLQEALHCDMSTITKPLIEWHPTPATNYLNDRTAFDVYLECSREDGTRGFIAVETKYTDSFSNDWRIRQAPAKKKKYRHAAAATGDYDMDRIEELFHRKVSQLFRMALLAELWRRAGGFDFGLCVVAALADDVEAVEAVERLSRVHLNPSYIVRHRAHEELVEAFATISGLEAWGADFRRRYLDLGPTL
jgi:hypothetical protein